VNDLSGGGGADVLNVLASDFVRRVFDGADGCAVRQLLVGVDVLHVVAGVEGVPKVGLELVLAHLAVGGVVAGVVT